MAAPPRLVEGAEEVIGWVYLATAAPRVDRLCKVGRSLRPKARMAELRVPGLKRVSPTLVTTWKVWRQGEAEVEALNALAAYRIEGQKEWFLIDATKAAEIVGKSLSDRNQLWREHHAWHMAESMWLDPVTVAHVVQRTGLAQRTLYRRFGPKGTPKFGKAPGK